MPDDSAWYREKAGGDWSEWTSLGGVISGNPTLVASADRTYLFARADDYTLWQLNSAWLAVRGPNNAVHMAVR